MQMYRVASRELLEQAKRELSAGDVRQAAEKGWGAAAQMVEGVADHRSWEHRTHASLYQSVDRLVNETGDRQISSLFNAANALHVNFYENWMTPLSVSVALGDVEMFLDKLESLA